VIETVDLDLDVARRRDGTVVLLDEDEFEQHRRSYAYPARIVDHARAAAATLYGRIESRDEPFGSTGLTWLDRAIALSGEPDAGDIDT
jgi:protein associated with RNAse G/E